MHGRVSLVKTCDRAIGIRKAIRLLGVNPVAGRRVLLKPNFNSADPYPASTHNDTLSELSLALLELEARAVTIGERSGPSPTHRVFREKGVDELCRSLGIELINFEALPDDDWVRVRPARCLWQNGFRVARPVLEAERIVTTCCLKTHAAGGVYTAALKLGVGIIHKDHRLELHAGAEDTRSLIADVNLVYRPDLILLDAIEAFTEGGPISGLKKRADVILAGTDRIAIDAVGLAILKELGSNRDIMDTAIFAQGQIARAIEVGLDKVRHPEEIEIITADDKSRTYANRLAQILLSN